MERFTSWRVTVSNNYYRSKASLEFAKLFTCPYFLKFVIDSLGQFLEFEKQQIALAFIAHGALARDTGCVSGSGCSDMLLIL